MATSSGGVPPGFRFHPTDEELLHYYLRKKVSYQKFDMEVIKEVDLNRMEPWELQERCRIGSTPQNDWYFFSHKDKKYPTGSRTNRATNAGFWKATGRDKCIRNSYKKIGMRKTLVFYRGRAPHGQKTDWIMHEYRLEDGDDAHGNLNEDGWVVCRVFKKKNLFKIGNDQTSNINSSSSDHHQQFNNNTISSSNHHSRTSAFMQIENQYLLRGQHPELALNYSTSQMLPTPQYSLFQPQSLVPNYATLSSAADSPAAMVKQLMSNPSRDCESGSESLRYHHQQACEPGLEVGTCDQPTVTHHMVAAAAATGGREEQVLNDWTMLDRLVTEDSSKGVRFEDANAQHQINQLSLRGEMNFWGFDK